MSESTRYSERLLAAAPEMLAMLEEINNIVGMCELCELPNCDHCDQMQNGPKPRLEKLIKKIKED